MAPPSEPLYKRDEKALCFHHELLYEAKVLDSKPVDPNDKKSAYQYKVHYKGWKNTYVNASFVLNTEFSVFALSFSSFSYHPLNPVTRFGPATSACYYVQNLEV